MNALKVNSNNLSPLYTSHTPHLTPAIAPRPRAAQRKIALPTLEGIHFEKVANVISLEAKGNYTTLHFLGGRQLLVSKTLRDLESLLNADARFVRIHRSFTINMDHLLKYIKGKGGYVVMEDGTNVNVSAGRKQAFLDALKVYFG